MGKEKHHHGRHGWTLITQFTIAFASLSCSQESMWRDTLSVLGKFLLPKICHAEVKYQCKRQWHLLPNTGILGDKQIILIHNLPTPLPNDWWWCLVGHYFQEYKLHILYYSNVIFKKMINICSCNISTLLCTVICANCKNSSWFVHLFLFCNT